MPLWQNRTLRSLALPGGLLFIVAWLQAEFKFPRLADSSLDLLYYAGLLAGGLLALRFRSSKILLGLAFLFLSRRSIEFFSAGHASLTGPGLVALQTVALLLPLNFLLLSLSRERGFSASALPPWFTLIFLESVFVAVLCRPGQSIITAFFRHEFLSPRLLGHGLVAQPGLLTVVASLVVLLTLFLKHRNALDAGLLWSLAAAFLALESGARGHAAVTYLAASVLVLLAAAVENSYLLAYQDELTGLPGRRAFNEATWRLQEPYAIAAVDIDHFKAVNDTFGHDTGDDVLRLVASRLAQVKGGGEAYRVGGEEFSILFSGKPASDVLACLEDLRQTVEASSFRVRAREERRRVARGNDRRAAAPRNSSRRHSRPARATDSSLSVTISIGVADSSSFPGDAERVAKAADRALYRAKQSGRNRVEAAAARRTPARPRIIA